MSQGGIPIRYNYSSEWVRRFNRPDRKGVKTSSPKKGIDTYARILISRTGFSGPTKCETTLSQNSSPSLQYPQSRRRALSILLLHHCRRSERAVLHNTTAMEQKFVFLACRVTLLKLHLTQTVRVICLLKASSQNNNRVIIYPLE